jgi:hypothetical protein
VTKTVAMLLIGFAAMPPAIRGRRLTGLAPWPYRLEGALSAGAFVGRRLLRAQQLEWPLAHPRECLRGRSHHKYEPCGAVRLR